MSRLIVTSILVQDPQPTNHNPQSPSVIFHAPFSWGWWGWCIKADHCDYLHKNQCYQYRATTTKHLVPCPFLKNKGFCLKGSLCDFSHAHISTITNRNSSFFEKRQDLVKKVARFRKSQDQFPTNPIPDEFQPPPLDDVNYVFSATSTFDGSPRISLQVSDPPRLPEPFLELKMIVSSAGRGTCVI